MQCNNLTIEAIEQGREEPYETKCSVSGLLDTPGLKPISTIQVTDEGFLCQKLGALDLKQFHFVI